MWLPGGAMNTFGAGQQSEPGWESKQTPEPNRNLFVSSLSLASDGDWLNGGLTDVSFKADQDVDCLT